MRKKRFLCLFLALTMVLSAMPYGVFAAEDNSRQKVSWSNISGETGYQISKMTSGKAIQKKPLTYKTTSGKTYYYRVRAYKVVNGKTIYGPWSSPVKYKRK